MLNICSNICFVFSLVGFEGCRLEFKNPGQEKKLEVPEGTLRGCGSTFCGANLSLAFHVVLPRDARYQGKKLRGGEWKRLVMNILFYITFFKLKYCVRLKNI
jgi:hypothetical protein